MGKSAKFYKRPTKKEKEQLSNIPKTEQTAIKKAAPVEKKKAISSKLTRFHDTEQATTLLANGMDIDTPKLKTKTKEPKQPELPDYVDLLSGKKTYKRIPKRI